MLNQVLTNLFFLNRSFSGILFAAVIQPAVLELDLPIAQQMLKADALRIQFLICVL